MDRPDEPRGPAVPHNERLGRIQSAPPRMILGMDDYMNQLHQMIEGQRVVDQQRLAEMRELLSVLRANLGDPIQLRLYGHVVIEAHLIEAMGRNTEAILQTIAVTGGRG